MLYDIGDTLLWEANSMRVQESRENYLEAILMLQKKHGYVRSVDVANHLNFSRAASHSSPRLTVRGRSMERFTARPAGKAQV